MNQIVNEKTTSKTNNDHKVHIKLDNWYCENCSLSVKGIVLLLESAK